MLGMQEPEIFEQPVGSANKDPETAVHEEPTYVTAQSYYGTANGPGPTAGGLHHVVTESSSEDFHLFVYPEGT